METEEQQSPQNQPEKPKNSLKEYFKLGEVAGYFFRRKDPNRPANFNIKVMHGINRISILIFLVAVIVLVLRRLL